jgi:hypothetical protein
MAAVTTSIDGVTGGVAIAWTAPADGSDPIDRYSIEVKKADGTWLVDPPGCNGGASAIVTARTCVVPMAELTGATFGLAFDVLVEARASAGNAYGLGLPSPVNTEGARTRRAPDEMSAPIAVSVTEA